MIDHQTITQLKIKLRIIALIFSIISAFAYGSIFFFESFLEEKRQNVANLEYELDKIIWNMQEGKNNHEIARSLRNHIDILRVFKVDTTQKQEEEIELLIAAASSMVALAKTYHKESFDSEKLFEEQKAKIISYETFLPIFQKALLTTGKYHNDLQHEINSIKQGITKINSNKLKVISISILLQVFSLLLIGISELHDKILSIKNSKKK